MQTTIALLSAFLILTGPPPSRSASAGQSGVQLDNCIVKLIDDIDVPARAAGLLMAVNVKEGDYVEANQQLGQIDDADAKLQRKAAELELAVAQEQAKNDINVRYAKAARDVADAEVKMSEWVNQREPGTIPETQLKTERLAAHRAELQIEVSELELRVAKLNSQVNQAKVDTADEEIRRRRIEARWAGKVEQLFKRAGEWVNPGDPVMRLVRMDRLRVEGVLSAAKFSPAEVAGRRVVIEVELAYGVEKFAAAVDYVGSLVEAGDDFRVWAEVDNVKKDNHWVLLDGLNAKMTILLDAPSAAAAP